MQLPVAGVARDGRAITGCGLRDLLFWNIGTQALLGAQLERVPVPAQLVAGLRLFNLSEGQVTAAQPKVQFREVSVDRRRLDIIWDRIAGLIGGLSGDTSGESGFPAGPLRLCQPDP